MLFKIILGLAAIIGAFLTYVAFQPSYHEISRSITVNAPANKIFPYLNKRALVNSWNPFLAQDPAAKLSVSGPEEGVGAKTSWSEGKILGTGSATVTESVPNERVVIKLEYQKPFAMTQDASYLMSPAGEQTQVTWKVQGHNTFMMRAMCSFVNMDKKVGDTFSQGLADLKALVEKTP